MGGLITMTLAALRPKAIAASVLNDVGPEIGRPGLERILSYVGKPVSIESWGDAADYMKRINGVAFPDYCDSDWQDFARRTFRDESGKPVLDYDPAITVPLATRPIRTKSLVSSCLFRRLARRRPTLLVRGELSDLLDSGITERMSRAAPRLKVAVVPRVGHAPTLTEPVARKAIDEFLASVP
jgi:pimeloyl-ACP methyl ester carboxylesterase